MGTETPSPRGWIGVQGGSLGRGELFGDGGLGRMLEGKLFRAKDAKEKVSREVPGVAGAVGAPVRAIGSASVICSRGDAETRRRRGLALRAGVGAAGAALRLGAR